MPITAGPAEKFNASRKEIASTVKEREAAAKEPGTHPKSTTTNEIMPFVSPLAELSSKPSSDINAA